MVIVVMGVSGSGKSTVGRKLAERLGWPFHDADYLHPEANKSKMHRGIPLTDEDRMPWLEAIRELIAGYLHHGRNAIVACSALKRSYRTQIGAGLSAVKFVYLQGEFDLIERRLAERHGHFFDPHLLRSQFDDLEEPADAVIEEITHPPDVIVESIIARLRLVPGD